MFKFLAGTKRKVEADDVSALQQKRQRMESEKLARRTFLEDDDDLNSSLQSPLLSHHHNQLMRSEHQLQSLPDSILARIFCFTELIQDEPIDLPMSRGFIDKNSMALIFVSHRLHKLALRIFWSANDFTIRINKFNAAAILPWWKHVNAVRQLVEEKPIMIADPKRNNFFNADFTPLTSILPIDVFSDYDFLLRRSKPWSTTTLPLGIITLDVPYDPHWSNLKTWLHLFHEGKVPALIGSDITSGTAEWRDLHQIVGLFLSVQRDKGGEWEDVEKSLEGWQYTLKFADSRWQFENGPVKEALGLYDSDEEGEAVDRMRDTAKDDGDLLDQLSQHLENTPNITPGCNSTATFGSSPPPSSLPYHTPRPTQRQRPCSLPDSDGEEDLYDGGEEDERMSSPEL